MTQQPPQAPLVAEALELAEKLAELALKHPELFMEGVQIRRLAKNALALTRQLEQAEREKERLMKALEQIELDARWIVGQWQRLRDEPTKRVALAIVDRITALSEQNTKPSGEVGEG